MADQIDKVLDALSKKLGVPREKIIEILVNKLADTGKYRSLDLLEKLSGKKFMESDITLNDIFKYKMMEKLMGDNDVDLNKILLFGMIRQMFQPDLTSLLLLERISTKKTGGNEEIVKYLIQQQQQQQQLMITLLTSLFGKQTQEQIERVIQETRKQQEQIRREFDEKLQRLAEAMARDLKSIAGDREQLAQYLQQLAQMIQQKPGGAKMLIDMIKEYKELQEALKEVAKTMGIAKTDIPVKEGEIDWGALLGRLLDIAETYVKTKAGQPPIIKPLPETPSQILVPQKKPEIKIETQQQGTEEFKPLPENTGEELPVPQQEAKEEFKPVVLEKNEGGEQ